MSAAPSPGIAATQALRVLIWQHGYRPMPVYSWDFVEPPPPPGKKPKKRAGKVPLGNEWEMRARQDPPECIALASPVLWALNTGILADGLRVIDLDIDDPGLAGGVRALALTMLGSTIVRTRSNSPRCLLVYRAQHGEPTKIAITGAAHSEAVACKIEVLGRGQQFVAYGRHPSGAELQWLDGGPADVGVTECPAITEAQLDDFLTEAAKLIGAAPPKPVRAPSPANGQDYDGPPTAELVDIAAAVAAMENSGPPDWESWNNNGLAIYAATEGAETGRALWLGWSAKHPAYDEAHALERWTNYGKSPPNRTGAGKLFALAVAAHPEWIRPSEAAALGIGIAVTEGQGVPVDGNGETGADPNDPWSQPAQPAQPEPEEPEELPDYDWPEPMALPAFHGPIGEAVALLMPETEADQQALLFQLLAFTGNRIGRGPYYPVKKARHGCNLFVLLAGDSSRARKGTSETEVRSVFEVNAADPWLELCIQSGLSSGEGVIHAVRDASYEINKKTGERELADAGVSDKRLLIVESEFASPLAVMKRQGNTLSPVLRRGWDGGRLQIMTKNAPSRATGAAISIVGHITIDELRGEVDRIQISNGFLNRFLFAVVKRARRMPFGGTVDQAKLDEVGWALAGAVEAARQIGEVTMSEPTRDLWRASYDTLTADHPGLFGSLISRAEAQVVRLSLLYALMDQSAAIEPVHLEAALAVWRYSEDSARLLFGPLVGDPVADSLLVFLKGAGKAGMSRTELHSACNRQHSSARLQLALEVLLKQGRVRRSKGRAPGRSGPFTETWVYIPRRRP